jgi:multiple sugar transport system substrate-binding protein
MGFAIDRRRLLGTAAGAAAASAAWAPRARAASRKLLILAHRVHQTSLTQGAAGDLTKAWRDANDADIEWVTADTNPLQDRLFREASLPATDFGVGFLVNSRAVPDRAKLMQGLNDFQARAPIEDFPDIAPGLVDAMRFDGQLAAVPFRHATLGLFYNEALMAERGITALPKTLEELVDQAGKLTFTSAAGTPVTGMVLASDLTTFPVTFVRAFGGDFIGANMQLLPDPAAMEKALATMAGMYRAGSLPRTYATTSNEDQATWMMQGRAAFTVLPFARYAQLNHAQNSKYPGRIKVTEFPVSESVAGRVRMASPVEFWAMCVPANARDKELAWSFIRAMSTKEVTMGAARNGNGPVRVSTYRDPEFIAAQPTAPVEAAALANARVPLPAFPEAARAQAVFLEEVQLTVLGRKTPAAAVAAISERVRPLLPS